MKFIKKDHLFFILFFLLTYTSLKADVALQANWISHLSSQNATNTWFCFRKDFSLDGVPSKAVAKIAADSKYWLWVNGKLVVFEGGLKRGPNPNDTYYDEIDLSRFLEKGQNSISVLTWFFGKDGFSHISSGKAGLLFECIAPGIRIVSDRSWKVMQHPAYETCGFPYPNFRLSESSIRYDGRRDIGLWQNKEYDTSKWSRSWEWGIPPVKPWNNLVLRPIPFWKNSGLTEYVHAPEYPFQCVRDTVITCTLPANVQMTPYLKIDAPEGLVIDIRTDDYNGGGETNMRAEYVTRNGVQEYESYGWLNGHQVIYTIPKGVRVLGLKYRETGYDTEFAGSFNSSDDFLNRIWEKSRRTLYVTMRDSYMDCPDRERAQWWGDEVNEGGEAFYALCPQSHLLFRKGMYELIGFQRADSSLFSPVPSANWEKELPSQMLSSVGYYGFWNYYLNTGDRQTIADLYGGVRKYLQIWKINDRGTVVCRPGEWTWGDWGEEVDMTLIYNALYYMALKSAANMADLLKIPADVAAYTQTMKQLKTACNQNFWTGTAYRNPDYKGKTDDRSQALAVVSGLADKDKYPAIFKVLQVEEHASPYMEKYVLEALFQMGYEDFAIQRMKKRFGKMVNYPGYTTLFEGWGIGAEGFGGGTTNHAWSGGALTILSQYLCGIAPLEPGYSTFQIVPQPASVGQASAKILSVKGPIESSFINKPGRFELSVVVPKGTDAVVGIPDKEFSKIEANGKKVWGKGKFMKHGKVSEYSAQAGGFVKFKVPAGSWHFVASK